MQGKTLSTKIALTSFVDNTSRVARPRFESFLEQRSLPFGRRIGIENRFGIDEPRGRYISGPQALLRGKLEGILFLGHAEIIRSSVNTLGKSIFSQTFFFF